MRSRSPARADERGRIGDDRPYVTALLTLDPDACAAYAAKAGLDDGTPPSWPRTRVRALIQPASSQANEKLARVEQIKKFTVLPRRGSRAATS